MHEPVVEVALKLVDCLVERSAKSRAEELIQHRSIEVLDKAVALWPSDAPAAMLDLIERQVELVAMGLRATELAPVVGEDSTNRNVALLVERQDVAMRDGDGRFPFRDSVQETKGATAVGVDNGMERDTTHSPQGADEEDLLAEQFAWPATFDMPFPVSRILFL